MSAVRTAKPPSRRRFKNYPKYKGSGVEWLGEIPAHWDLMFLDKLVDPLRPITYGIVQPGEPDPDGILMVRGQNYSRGWDRPEDLFRVSPAIERPYKRARLKAVSCRNGQRGTDSYNKGAAQPGLNLGHIAKYRVVIPPLAEQGTIASYLDRETASFDALVVKVDEAIDRLKELRTALISAAVTGKIDVRQEVA